MLYLDFYRRTNMPARDTFHFSKEFFNSFELNEERSFTYSDAKFQERNAARQQTYRFNRKCRESNISKKFSITERQDGLTIKRVV